MRLPTAPSNMDFIEISDFSTLFVSGDFRLISALIKSIAACTSLRCSRFNRPMSLAAASTISSNRALYVAAKSAPYVTRAFSPNAVEPAPVAIPPLILDACIFIVLSTIIASSTLEFIGHFPPVATEPSPIAIPPVMERELIFIVAEDLLFLSIFSRRNSRTFTKNFLSVEQIIT